ncbi:MAG: PD-(D/E)XK motif protein [Flavobacteriales bacterium]|nr:PD-(D/E)XK motif protein [Flavobacteriales bacterium]
MNELEKAYAALSASHVSDGRAVYSTIPVNAQCVHLLARTPIGEPCLLILLEPQPIPNPPALRLEYISVVHGLTGRVHEGANTEEALFSLVTLHNIEAGLVEAFLRFAKLIALQLPHRAEPDQVATCIRRFVDLLQSLRQQNRRSIQGLWAELFVLSQRADVERWIEGWHEDPRGLHDFVLGDTRVEVKSTSTQQRKHYFSHLQLNAPHGSELWVASLITEPTRSGRSVFDLAQTLRERLGVEANVILDEMVASTLGVDYGKAGEVRFDYARALESLLFFPLARIPKLEEEVPDLVSDVSYCVQLIDSDGQRDLHFA